MSDELLNALIGFSPIALFLGFGTILAVVKSRQLHLDQQKESLAFERQWWASAMADEPEFWGPKYEEWLKTQEATEP